MKVRFLAKSMDYHIDFTTDVEIKDNHYIFKDESMNNTTMTIGVIDENQISLQRVGETNMLVKYNKGLKTTGEYQNSLGLEFKFQVYCSKINIKSNNIFFEYDYFMNNEKVSTHKIWVLIK